jgi:purine-binding chemotaxis protein CheW
MASLGGMRALEQLLVCRVGAKLCALPLGAVLETMRPLPTEPLPGVPPFVSGVALIRSRPTPVVDARRLLGTETPSAPARYVTLVPDSGRSDRVTALAVDAVVGIRSIDVAALAELPGLLRHESETSVAALGTLDAELLLVLEHARLLPESVWRELEREQVPA